MIVYRTIDGTNYRIKEGQEAELVEALRAGMLRDLGSNREYMENLQSIIFDQFGICLDITNEKRFLDSLVAMEILDRFEK